MKWLDRFLNKLINSQPPSPNGEKFGTVFYSRYFNSRGVVISYYDNNNWFFVLESGPYAGRIQKAQTNYNNVEKN